MNAKSFDLLTQSLALAKPENKNALASEITALTQTMGVYPAAIGAVYHALGKGELPAMTIPALISVV